MPNSRFAEPEGYTMRWLLGVVGAAAVLGSLIGLTLPLSLQVVDRSGMPIACGIGFHPDHHVAAHEDAVNKDLRNTFGALYELSDYTAQCDAIVDTRRRIACSVLGFGGALLALLLIQPYARQTGQLLHAAASTFRRRAAPRSPATAHAQPPATAHAQLASDCRFPHDESPRRRFAQRALL
jgi:hypothetical protein